ncbi:hypothetical protein ACWCOV_41245 [Kribbella sp. NPDC002412]
MGLPAAGHVDQMDPSWKSLTVRQILSHTSGIDQMLTTRWIIPKLWDLTEPSRGVPDVMGPNDSGPWTLAYINERLFAPAGIAPASRAPRRTLTPPRIPTTSATWPRVALWNAGQPNCAGHRGLQMSAVDLVRWHTHQRLLDSCQAKFPRRRRSQRPPQQQTPRRRHPVHHPPQRHQDRNELTTPTEPPAETPRAVPRFPSPGQGRAGAL